MTDQVNVRDLTDAARIRPIHILVVAICFATAIVDGLDNQVIGFSAPAIAADLGIPLSAFGAIFSAGTVGTLIGAMGLGRLADRFGRQRALTLYTLSFAVLTMATPLANTTVELSIMRFLGGLGLGGAMPVFLTLVSEYAPKSRRALATGVLWCGYPTGGMIGSLLGSQVVSRYGWESMFFVGGALGVAVAVLQWLMLPESLQFLAMKGGQDDRIRTIAAKVEPGADLTEAQFVADTPVGERAAMSEVFAEGRTGATVLLWIPLFLTFMISNFFVLWSPGLLRSAGLPLSTAALMVALNNFAAIPSQAATGYFIDRTGPFRMVPVAFGILAVVIAAMSFSLTTVPIVAAAMLAVGLLQGPCIAGMLFLATSIYPSKVRATGVGLAMGIGRSGQVIGAMLIGGVLAQGATPQWVFLGMATPPVIALVCVLLLGLRLRASSPAQHRSKAA
jgi:AAHS family 4-hydroxybenzoate transporter-like MFS transporter